MRQSGTATQSASAGSKDIHDDSRRVRIPSFPVYAEVRHLLRIWPGRPKSHITGLHSVLAQLRGTPKNPVNWTEPDTWIPAKLRGDNRALAHAIWSESGGAVNPRHTMGHWRLVQVYELLVEGADRRLLSTDRGRDFIDHELGEAESFLDRHEGIIELLAIVANSGPAPIRELVEPWSEYLARHSNFRSDSTIKDTLRRRLNNLLNRNLVTRERAMYAVPRRRADHPCRRRQAHRHVDRARNRRPQAQDRDPHRRSGRPVSGGESRVTNSIVYT